jgi:hypothetical protein
MRRARILGICLSVGCALLACAATSALAAQEWGKCAAQAGGKYKNSGCSMLAKSAEEHKFEWAPLAAPVGFETVNKAETGNITLQSSGGTQVACTAEQSKQGQYTSPTELRDVVLELRSCETLGGKCQSAGLKEGEVSTRKLHGSPGVIAKGAKVTKNKDGFDLKGQESEAFAEFTCGPAPFVIRGALILPQKINKMLNKAVVELSGSAPEKFEGGPPEPLEVSVAGAPYERLGWTEVMILKTSPKTTKIELRDCLPEC